MAFLTELEQIIQKFGGGIEQKGKRTHGHGQQCGDCWGEGI